MSTAVDDLEMSRMVRQLAPELWTAVLRNELNLPHAYTAAMSGVRNYSEYAEKRRAMRVVGARVLADGLRRP